ncbi:MAG TPA: lipase family protein, partial [Solirubrobacteraceae bacterium]|nr:lipase family protein [Solirubrobacteraceae bacterium]
SGWAAQVQPSYAPKLNVRGVAVGGFATNLAEAVQNINGGFGAGLIASVLDGVARTVPALAAAINTYVTPAGKAILAKGVSQCELANVTQYAFMNLNNYLTIPLTQLLALPAIKNALNGIGLGGTAPTAPMFVYHSVDDELIPVAGPDATVAKYCAAGDSVTYTRDILSEHVSLAFIGAPQALSWLTQRLTGGAVPHGCHTTTVLTMLLNPTTLTGGAKLLLADAGALLDQPIGPAGIF